MRLIAQQAKAISKIVPPSCSNTIGSPSLPCKMRPALMHSVREALDKPWVLDIDATIKAMYGRQEGADWG